MNGYVSDDRCVSWKRMIMLYVAIWMLIRKVGRWFSTPVYLRCNWEFKSDTVSSIGAERRTGVSTWSARRRCASANLYSWAMETMKGPASTDNLLYQTMIWFFETVCYLLFRALPLKFSQYICATFPCALLVRTYVVSCNLSDMDEQP